MLRASLLLIGLVACGGGGGTADPDASRPDHDAGLDAGPDLDAAAPDAGVDAPVWPDEEAARAELEATPVELRGRVVDTDGAPVAGAEIAVGVEAALSDAAGEFVLPALPRRNELLAVDAIGFHREHVPVQLFRPVAVASITLDPIVLSRSADGARFVFGGDVSFGRRFLDPAGTTPRDQMPPDDPAALILVSDPEPGTRAAVGFVRPVFEAADHAVVNLETPVLLDPSTPHPDKDYCFFTLPGSLPALSWMGLDYVGLGNNHVYDYLDSGITQTLGHVAAAGLPHSGAGLTPAAAFAPAQVTVDGTPYSHVSMTSIAGTQWDILYVATADQGGAADARDDALATATIDGEVDAGRVAIVHIHTGEEYTSEPGAYARGRIQLAAAAGASLVVAHHPHVAQGIGVEGGVVAFHSLGNLAFDQDRLETMLGLVAEVDLDGGTVRAARGLPVYLEDYRPRFAVGALADHLARQVGEASHGYGAHVVFGYLGRAWLARDAAEVVALDRVVTVSVSVTEAGWGVVDLRGELRPGESLASARATAALQARPGRDLSMHGGFEDEDVDGELLELSRWSFGSSSRACVAAPYRGTAELCSERTSTNTSDSVIALRNRVRTHGVATATPWKDLSLVGALGGDNAGPVRIVVSYGASEGDATFGPDQDAFVHPGGTFGWLPFAADLALPADVPGDPLDPLIQPRAVRLWLHHAPPAGGTGRAHFDELAVVGWEEQVDLAGAGATFAAPHARSFLRVSGAPGTYQLELVLRRHVPAAAAP